MNRQNKMSPQQKSILDNFIQVTNISLEQAVPYLNQFNWNLNIAIESYFASMGGYNQTISGGTKADKQYEEGAKQFYATFKSLSDDTPDKLGPNSIQRFLEAFNYDETDRRVLIFAWLANAEIQCEFSMAELEMVFKKLKVTNMQDLQRNLDRINNQLDRPEDKVNFDSLYEFTFLFAKTTPNQKGLNAEVAIAYWKILYKTNNASYGIVQKWFEFLGDVNQKYISRDTWNLFNSFTRVINADFSNHSSNDSWPVLIDEFVDYVRSKQRFAEEKVKGVVLSDEKGYPMLNKGDCNAGSAGFVAQLAKVASELDKSKLVRVHLESKQDIFIITPNNQMTLGIHKTK